MLKYAPVPTEEQLLTLGVQLGFPVAFERRIEGGLGCTTDVLRAGGEHWVLRRHGPWWIDRNPAVALKEEAVLGLLADSAIPVPRPLWATETAVFGVPVIVMEYVDGQDLLLPGDPNEAARQLGETLAGIHAIEPDETAVALLEEPTSMDGERPSQFWEHPDAGRVASRLDELRARLAPSSVLIHGDFWPGNTLWRNGHLAAVIDWEEATLGDPMSDVAYCALDLRYLGLDDAAGTFLETYTSVSGRSTESLPYWTLFALSRPMPDIAQWLPAWTAKGITHISAEDLRARHQELLAEALS